LKWNEIKIHTNSKGMDAVSAFLYDLEIEGFEIVGGEYPESGDWDYIEEALVSEQNTENIIFKVYLEDDQNYPSMQKTLFKGLESLKKRSNDFIDISFEVALREDSEWTEVWKKYFKPFKAGEKIVICPEWEQYSPKDDEIMLKIDPGAAFGSGLHETTQMCIAELEKYVSSKSEIIDIGCGSGILSIAAAKLGANSVLALDRDKVCIDITKENCSINETGNTVEAKISDLLSDTEVRHADIIVANIIADVIISLNKNVREYLKTDGIYIMSGIIADRLKDVLDSLENMKFKVLNISEMGEWRAVTATPKMV